MGSFCSGNHRFDRIHRIHNRSLNPGELFEPFWNATDTETKGFDRFDRIWKGKWTFLEEPPQNPVLHPFHPVILSKFSVNISSLLPGTGGR